MEKLILTVATTGAVTSKQDNPNLPVPPKEIAESVYEAYQAGGALAPNPAV